MSSSYTSVSGSSGPTAFFSVGDCALDWPGARHESPETVGCSAGGVNLPEPQLGGLLGAARGCASSCTTSGLPFDNLRVQEFLVRRKALPVSLAVNVRQCVHELV